MAFRFKIFKELQKLHDALDRPQSLLRVVNRSLAEESLNLIGGGFDRERDPYGKRWKPKKRPDGRKTLSGVTGRLKNGWHIKNLTYRGFTVAPSVEYALYHQDPRINRRTGKLKRPRRMMIPSTKHGGMPRAWAREMRAAIEDAIVAFYANGGRTRRRA